MIDPKMLHSLSKQFIDKLPPTFKNLHAEIEDTFNTVLQSAFSKMNLVSREEFDSQCALLAANKHKLEALQAEIEILSEKIIKLERS
jgi:BMFP domain-containing protein YqiC